MGRVCTHTMVDHKHSSKSDHTLSKFALNVMYEH